MVDKLNKLIRKNEVKKEHLSKNNYEKRVINLTEVNFNTEEKEMLAKRLKYAPPPELNQEKTIIAVSYTHLDVYKRQQVLQPCINCLPV